MEGLRGIDDVVALRYMLPWLAEEVIRTRSVTGHDYWTYGLDAANTATLQTLIRYSHEQGLAKRPYRAAELFAPEPLEATLI